MLGRGKSTLTRDVLSAGHARIVPAAILYLDARLSLDPNGGGPRTGHQACHVLLPLLKP